MEMDDRFKHIGKDPRFRELKRRDRKVQIDSRFKGMFKDDKFKVIHNVVRVRLHSFQCIF